MGPAGVPGPSSALRERPSGAKPHSGPISSRVARKAQKTEPVVRRSVQGRLVYDGDTVAAADGNIEIEARLGARHTGNAGGQAQGAVQ